MEDYIYYLMLVVWLVFSFYQQSQKKKRKKAEMEAAQARQEQNRQYDEQKPAGAGTEAPPDSGFKKILEELLGEEEVLVPEYETRPVEVTRNFDEESVSERNEYQKYLESKSYKEGESLEMGYLSRSSLEDKIVELEKDMKLQEHELEVTESHYSSAFNLRSAVIYSEVLKRKY
ncbi:MAG: hypothetical protein IH598_14765 [Bacteroidales bacterium]|nr:hypothetical protein [Bacteroidales bacterium]